jgi:hypothetical protein
MHELSGFDTWILTVFFVLSPKDTATLEISSNNVALFVRLDLQLPRTDVVFSDNGFILFPNRPRTITLRSLVDQSLPSVEDLARCVSVTSLRDSY